MHHKHTDLGFPPSRSAVHLIPESLDVLIERVDDDDPVPAWMSLESSEQHPACWLFCMLAGFSNWPSPYVQAHIGVGIYYSVFGST